MDLYAALYTVTRVEAASGIVPKDSLSLQMLPWVVAAVEGLTVGR